MGSWMVRLCFQRVHTAHLPHHFSAPLLPLLVSLFSALPSSAHRIFCPAPQSVRATGCCVLRPGVGFARCGDTVPLLAAATLPCHGYIVAFLRRQHSAGGFWLRWFCWAQMDRTCNTFFACRSFVRVLFAVPQKVCLCLCGSGEEERAWKEKKQREHSSLPSQEPGRRDRVALLPMGLAAVRRCSFLSLVPDIKAA
jgi:hypothetical protein